MPRGIEIYDKPRGIEIYDKTPEDVVYITNKMKEENDNKIDAMKDNRIKKLIYLIEEMTTMLFEHMDNKKFRQYIDKIKDYLPTSTKVKFIARRK